MRSAFSWCNWFGMFPLVYDADKRMFVTSVRGLLVGSVYALVVGREVQEHLVSLFSGAEKKTSAVSAIVRAVNGLGLFTVLLRRIAFVRDMVRSFNGLSEWPVGAPVRTCSTVIFRASAAAVLLEFVGDNVARIMKDKPINMDYLTTYAFLGFEMQLIHTFYTIGQLYGDLNNYIEVGMAGDLDWIRQARHRNFALYTFCKKLNSHYSTDLIIHLSCYQLYLLLVLFKVARSLSESLGTDNFFYSFIELKIIVRLIRLSRLIVVFVYLVESCSYLHRKSVFTFYYILRSRVNYMRHQTKEQLYLFLNELNATEVTITASQCYDVNMKFLYSVSGSIVAYIILVVSFLCNQV